jgi:hypothetical protein
MFNIVTKLPSPLMMVIVIISQNTITKSLLKTEPGIVQIPES